MNTNNFQIQNYSDKMHREQVIGLWEKNFGYTTARNTPTLIIDKKLAIDDHLPLLSAIPGLDLVLCHSARLRP